MHTERSFLHQIPSRVTAMCSQITPNHVNSNCVTGKKLIFTTIENWYRKLWESMTIALSPFLYTNLSKLFSPFMPIKKKILNKITTFSLHCYTILLQGPQVTVKPSDAVYV